MRNFFSKSFKRHEISLSVNAPPAPRMRAWRLIALFVFSLGTSAKAQQGLQQTNSVAANSTNYVVAEIGANSQVWQNVTSAFNQSGQVTYRTNSYQEIATGLNHLVSGKWMPSSENIEITAGGGVATNGQHQVNFAANINASNAVQITTPDGLQLNTHILGMSFYDSATGSNVLFAVLQDSIGQVVTDNQVVYPNAFTDCNADVRYTYTRAGFEQDIVVQQQLASPESYGLNPDTTWLQVWTEFYDPPSPAIETILDGADVRLDFGMYKMERGKAFIMGNETNAVPVSKSWRTVQGRTFLVEQVQFNDVATQLQSLPAPSSGGGGTNGTGVQQIRFQGFPKQLPPAPTMAKRANESLKLAEKRMTEKGLVLDYKLENGNVTNLTFQGDTTYYVTGDVNLYLTTTIEGGTVVKFANTGAYSLNIHGPVNCQTGPYRMAVFTSQGDNTVGQTISGGGGGALYALSDQYNGGSLTLQYLRISYATFGFSDSTSQTNTIKHCQFVNDSYAIWLGGSETDNLQNDLFNNIGTVVFATFGTTINGVNLTVDGASTFFFSPPRYPPGPDPNTAVLNLVNSLLVSVANPGTSYTGYPNFTSSSSSVFTNAGAGAHYLASGTYRGQGTTSIDSSLLADLRNMTTYPPVVPSNFTTDIIPTITNNTTLVPSAWRDTNASALDIGYHYSPIDYMTTCDYSNCTVTLTNGVVLGYWRNLGISLDNGSQLVSQGAPFHTNVFVYYTLVQEQPVKLMGSDTNLNDYPTNSLPIATSHSNTNQNPSINLRFTSFYAPQGAVNILNFSGSGNAISNLTARDCEIYGSGAAWNLSDQTGAVSLINNLFQYVPLTARASGTFGAYNNLYRGNSNYTYWVTNTGGTITDQDNAFDGTSVILVGTGGHNAFLNGAITNSSLQSGDIVASNYTWVSGTLGSFYQGTNLLVDKGHTNAGALGLYHYTTQVNQTKEANSTVDIGYHYVSLDGSSLPMDSNSDGIPDYLEDANGNGFQDNGEALWFSMLKLSSPTLNFVIGMSPEIIDGGATITDPNCANLNSGVLTVSLVTNAQPEDVLGINNQGTSAGQIGVSGVNVTYGGTTIASFTGGTGTNALVISFNSSASPAAAQSLLDNLTFVYVPTGTESAVTRTVKFVMTDCSSETNPAVFKTIAVTCPVALDIMMVVDVSWYMEDFTNLPIVGNISFARMVGTNLIKNFYTNYDQAGLVTTSTNVMLRQNLTNNMTTNIQALAAIPPPVFDQTHNLLLTMSNAITSAQAELISTRHRSNALPVMILMSEGHVADDPNNSIIAATAAKAAGTRVIVFSLGTDAQTNLLYALATPPSNNYYYNKDMYGSNVPIPTLQLSQPNSICRVVPTISFTNPPNNHLFLLSPTNILLQATASEVNGAISNVQFFAITNGVTNSLGIIGVQPSQNYQLLWTNVTAGSYTLSATATDTNGVTVTATVTGIVVNDMPLVTLLTPTNSPNVQKFLSGANVLLSALASDNNGISRVDFYSVTNNMNGFILFGSVTNSTHPQSVTDSLVWTNPPPGTYAVYADATDTNNVAAFSKIAVFRIGPTNPPPTVSITYPTNGAIFPPDVDITITATATNLPGGAPVTNVEFFVNNQLIGNDPYAPYSIKECCWKPGTYAMTARATDANGLQTVSAPVNITIVTETPKSGGFWDPAFGLNTAPVNTFQLFTVDHTGTNAIPDGEGYASGLEVGSDGTIFAENLLVPPAPIYGYDGRTLYSSTTGTTWTSLGVGSLFTPLPYANWLSLADGTTIYAAISSDDSVSHYNVVGVAKWNGGTNWSSLGALFPMDINDNTWSPPYWINAFTKINGDFFIGGNFDYTPFVGTQYYTNVQRIARYNVVSNCWVTVGNGIANGAVYAIAEMGGHLYIGGTFTNAGGNPNANYVAELVGNTWTNMGTGISTFRVDEFGVMEPELCLVPGVVTLAACDTNLFVGGNFTTAGGNTNAYCIAYWNATGWHTMGSGVPTASTGDPTYPPHVYTISPHGNSVFVGGRFGNGFNPTDFSSFNSVAVATWSEAGQSWTWSSLDNGLFSDYSDQFLAEVYQSKVVQGSNPNQYDVYFAGFFDTAGESQTPSYGLARWRVGYPQPPGPPKVTISAPTNYAVLTNPPTTSVTITATANSPTTNIIAMDFIVDGFDISGPLSSSGSPVTTNFVWTAANGVYPFTNGVHVLKVSATDSTGLKAASTAVVINIKASNSVVANGDSYTIADTSPPTPLNVLTNDSPANSLRINQVFQYQQNLGIVSVGLSGTNLIYTPFANAYGTDNFYYGVTNGAGGSDLAAVSVSVLVPPGLTITSPFNGQTVNSDVYSVSNTVQFVGTVTGYDAPVTNVTLYINSISNSAVNGTNVSAFTFNWSNSTPFLDTFKLVAMDTYGMTSWWYGTFYLTNASTAGTTVTASITNLTDPTSLSAIYPVVSQGLFDLKGQAQVSTNTNTLAYRLMLYRPQDNEGQGQPDTTVPFQNVTPVPPGGALNGAGFRAGGDANGDLGFLNFSGVPDGIYDLQLSVLGNGAESNVVVRFQLSTQMKIGQFSFTQQDLALPVNGIPLTVTRTYNSMNPQSADFGYGWTFILNSMNVQLDEQRMTLTAGTDALPFDDGEDSNNGPPHQVSIRTGGDRDVTLTLPDGRQTTFQFSLVPTGDDSGLAYAAIWTPPSDIRATLTMTGDNEVDYLWGQGWLWRAGGEGSTFDNFDAPGWTLTTQDGTQYIITRGAGDLAIYQDPNNAGSYPSCTAYGPPQLTEILERTGAKIMISASGITNYDTNGLATRSMYFQRDTQNRITAVYDPNAGPNGLPVLRYVYNQDTGNLLQVLKLQDRTVGTYATNFYRYDNPNYPHYITAIQDADGIPVAENLYDANGLLTGTTDADGNTTTFVNNATNKIQIVVDRLNNTNYYAYDLSGNVTAQTNALNEVTLYAYDSLNNKTNEIMGYIATNGALVAMQTNSFAFDTHGFQTMTVDAMNRTNMFTYDTNGEMLTQTDPLNNVVSNTYDGGGNLISTTHFDPLGHIVDQSSSVYSNGVVIQTLNASNQVTETFGYDSSGNLASTTDANGFVHTFGYDANGNQTNSSYTWVGSGVTNTVTTATAYDAQNRVVLAIDALGNTNQTFYNANGRLDHTVDQYGNTNSFLYDDRGNLIQTTDVHGLITRTVYDPSGRAILTTDRNGITGTSTAYDADGRVTNTIRVTGVSVSILPVGSGAWTSVVTSNGAPYATNSTTYFASSWVKSRTGPDGQTTTYAYWPDGQLQTVTDPLTYSTHYQYDIAGRQSAIGDALSHTNQFQYDSVGRMIKTIYFDNSYTSNTFNGLGLRIATVDQAGLTKQYGYDVSGALTSVTMPQVLDPENTNAPVNPEWIYNYDAYERLTATGDPKGRTNTTAYDAYGRTFSQTLPMSQISSNFYDSRGRLWKQYDFLGQHTELHYDNFGRVTAKFFFAAGTNAPGKAVCYKFNQLGQLAQITERTGAAATTNACDGYTAVTGWHYDTLQAGTGVMWLLSRISPGTWGGLAGLGSIGLAIGLVPREKRRWFAMAIAETWQSWDVRSKTARGHSGRIFRLPGLGWKVVSYVLIFALFAADDRIWNFAAYADCTIPSNPNTFPTTRITQFTYDNDGHLMQIISPEGVVNYTYDAATGRHIQTCTANSKIAYGYDELGRLKTVIVLERNGTTLTTPETNTYTYTAVGNRSTVTLPSGVVTTYLYDNLNRLTNVASVNGTTILANYGYALYPSGRRQAAKEVLRQNGGTYLTNTLGWMYDGMYRLTNETSTSTATNSAGTYTVGYSYDQAGNRLTKTQVVGANTTTVTSTYNANDQLLTEVTKLNGTQTGANTYWYDANGSLTTKSNTAGVLTYAYDLQNKLSSVASGGTTNSFVYNDSGIRVSTTTGGSTMLYLIDPANPTGYAQILEELTSVGGAPTTSYVIGDDVLGQCGTTTTAPYYLLADGHGSTRQMTDLSGTVQSSFNYDVYGSQLSDTTGTVQTSIMYAGQQYDSTLNMYNLRARFYDPSNGRFNARDTFMGNNEDPQSLHKYAYGDCDPANKIDPSGQFTLIEALLVIVIVIIVYVAVFEAITAGINHLSGSPPTKSQNDALKSARSIISNNQASLPNDVRNVLNTALTAQIRVHTNLTQSGESVWGRTQRFGQVGRVIHLNSEAFSLDPKLLASLLIHEAVHTHQWNLSTSTAEHEAYQVQSDALTAWGLKTNLVNAKTMFPGKVNDEFIDDLYYAFQDNNVSNPAW